MIEVGTSGFLFDDWAGPVYPLGLPKSAWLPHYERALGFPILELNCTFYSLIHARSVAAMVDRTSPGFRFVVKAHHALTHRAADPAVLERFTGTVGLFREAGRFAGTLAQFPPRFLPTPRNFDAVRSLHLKLGDPFFVEFRNRGWCGAWLWNRMEREGLAFCSADLPRLRPLPRLEAVATAATAYLRLHGRNSSWYARPNERYDYLYSEEEIREIARLARELESKAPHVMVFFNNCRAGQAAQNARRLAEVVGTIRMTEESAPSSRRPAPLS